MNKMNKKGFTLIEMLVVIAIIAVLVAIIIPTVTSATDKAAAATNAANLRSIKAEVTTAYLTNDETYYDFTTANDGSVTVAVKSTKTLPAPKKCSTLVTDASAAAQQMKIEYNTTTKEFDVTYNGKKIKDFADFSEGVTN